MTTKVQDLNSEKPSLPEDFWDNECATCRERKRKALARYSKTQVRTLLQVLCELVSSDNWPSVSTITEHFNVIITSECPAGEQKLTGRAIGEMLSAYGFGLRKHMYKANKIHAFIDSKRLEQLLTYYSLKKHNDFTKKDECQDTRDTTPIDGCSGPS